MPDFDAAELEQKQLFIELVKALYCIQPRLFKGLNESQEKMILSLIESQLDDKKNLFKLIRHILPVNDEENQQLKTLLISNPIIAD
ncbi:hypothetical protein [Pedobacter agri]|nr:hypothetical protein [Pedobacter agri]